MAYQIILFKDVQNGVDGCPGQGIAAVGCAVIAGNKGMGGKNLNPDSQGTLEEIITGMTDYEYVIVGL